MRNSYAPALVRYQDAGGIERVGQVQQTVGPEYQYVIVQRADDPNVRDRVHRSGVSLYYQR